jgi:hypothetical protein
LPWITSASLTLSLSVERFEMASSLAGDCQQVIVGQSIGAAQNQPYHIDGFIARQPAHGHRRRVVDRSETMGQFGSCLALDFLREAGDHAVKQVDMFVGIVVGTREEQISDAAGDSACFSADPVTKVPSISAISDRSSITTSAVLANWMGYL